ncbi:hypothetical protein DQE82_26925 [Micromonospora sp. LHW51205]|uniref:hypothetical protein n=1 Tax=Micromonospora sp. LHW51205 TaxID=2248752 RepID=UPI000DEBB7C2|nr:hypothetical protein [Micromonospora sp. LHW51205]RBQ05180.1 hypothetical protein DQE82_26925 [Micromonospora sp. LHW51205]
MITLILAYLAVVLLLTTAGLALALHRSDRQITGLSQRCARQAARIRSYRAKAQLLGEACDRLAADLDRERAKVRHLQERNADLRDELDIATGAVEPSAIAEMTAFLANVDPEDFR